jgi:hypothetical protein
MRIISQTNVNGVQRFVVQDGDRFFSVSNIFYNNEIISSLLDSFFKLSR